MKLKKIAVIGGGLGVVGFIHDFKWFPELLDSAEVALYDVDEQKSNLMCRFLNALAKGTQLSVTCRSYRHRMEALEGANVVLSRFRPGGMHRTEKISRLALEQGYFADDTAAPVAISMFFDVIHPTLEIVRELEKVSPDAWFLNYTNPTQIVVDVILRASRIKAVGLCPGYLNANYDISFILQDVRPEEITVSAAGVNHHAWVIHAVIRGRDGYELLKERLRTIDRKQLQPYQQWALDMVEKTGYFPAPAGHMMPAFCNRLLVERIRAGLNAHWNKPLESTSGAAQNRLWERIKEGALSGNIPSLDGLGLKDLKGSHWLPQLEVEFINAVFSGRKTELHLNLPNRGLLPDLPEGAIVEGPTFVSGEVLEQRPMGKLNTAAVPVLQHVTEFAQRVRDAYLESSSAKLVEALMVHPATESPDQAQNMMKALAPYITWRSPDH